ncbi:hypothetical protein QM012_005229 [Aureobasidium pullulans]|uniref:Uncharacterized protein n=1 Tax=Aureobasidium pullulans TaxID=5580 RepID=A0ABR0T5W4_AURPU
MNTALWTPPDVETTTVNDPQCLTSQVQQQPLSCSSDSYMYSLEASALFDTSNDMNMTDWLNTSQTAFPSPTSHASVPNHRSLPTATDLVSAGSESHSRGGSDMFELNKNVTTESPRLKEWVSDLVRLNAGIFAQSTADIPSKTDDISFDLAMRLSELIDRLHVGAYSTPRTSVGSGSSDLAVATNDNIQPSREALIMLRDQSNSLLLMSSCVRLLGIFSTMLNRLEAQVTEIHNLRGEQQVNITLGTLNLAERPAMQCFLVVNMVELTLRRIGAVVQVAKQVERSLHVDLELQDTFCNIQHDRICDGCGSEVKLIADRVNERQVALLRKTDRIRGQLLES